ncbi:hypothetical protein Chor_012134 [Crotalus horridus]
MEEPRWAKALPKKRNPGDGERGKGKRAREGAGAAGIAPLAEGGSAASRPAAERMREEGEGQGRGGDSSNDAVRPQRPNGCSIAAGQEEEEEEEEGSAGQGGRPTRAGSAPGDNVCLSAPGQEVVMLKRSGAEDLQPSGEPRGSAEALMGELSEMVHRAVKSSSWWERHGVDDTIIALNLLSLPLGFLLLRSSNPFVFLVGIAVLGVVHHTLAVKASHLATHNALVESKSWGKLWSIFFIEVCSAFTAERGSYNHVKMHHAYTNVIGLGDSSTWKVPFLNRYVYMFIAPIAVPIITPLIAIGLLTEVELKTAIRTLCCIFIGLYAHYWLLLNISGFQSSWSALGCMLITRALLAHAYIHVNIFQHIGLPMFSPDKKPKRIHMMSCGVLNLPRNPLLDWVFGHSIISCHVEHHLFPAFSDNMCLKIKPVVSQYLKKKKLQYNEDSYWSRLKLFLDKYEELMVHAPPISELVGIQ